MNISIFYTFLSYNIYNVLFLKSAPKLALGGRECLNI